MRRTCAWCIWHKIIVLGCVVLGCVGLEWVGRPSFWHSMAVLLEGFHKEDPWSSEAAKFLEILNLSLCCCTGPGQVTKGKAGDRDSPLWGHGLAGQPRRPGSVSWCHAGNPLRTWCSRGAGRPHCHGQPHMRPCWEGPCSQGGLTAQLSPWGSFCLYTPPSELCSRKETFRERIANPAAPSRSKFQETLSIPQAVVLAVATR